MFKKIVVTTMLGALLNVSAQAGQETHGGVGIISGSKLYVLDLYEAGIEENSYIDTSIGLEKGLVNRLNFNFPLASNVPTVLLANKISEVSKLFPMLAFSLVRGMELFTWRFVNSSLINTNDEDPSIIVDPKLRVQIAVRKNSTIFINRDAWAKLSDNHKVALILHEVIYSFYKSLTSLMSTSARTREIVSYIMSESMEPKNEVVQKELNHIIGNPYEFGFSSGVVVYEGQPELGSCPEFYTTRGMGFNCGAPKVHGSIRYKSRYYKPYYSYPEGDGKYDSLPGAYRAMYIEYIEDLKDFDNNQARLDKVCSTVESDYVKLRKDNAKNPNFLNGEMLAQIIFETGSTYDVFFNPIENRLELKARGHSSLFSIERVLVKEAKDFKCKSEDVFPANAREYFKETFEKYTSNSWM